MAQSGIPLGEWSGSNATRELHETIKQFNEDATKQTEKMVSLTKRIEILTWILVVGLLVQIGIAIWH